MRRLVSLAAAFFLLAGCVEAGGGGLVGSREEDEEQRARAAAWDPCSLLPDHAVEGLLGGPPAETPRPTAPSPGPSGVGFRFCTWQAAGSARALGIGAAVAPVVPPAFDGAASSPDAQPPAPDPRTIGFDHAGVQSTPAGPVLFLRRDTLAFAVRAEGFGDTMAVLTEAARAVGDALTEAAEAEDAAPSQAVDDDDERDPPTVPPVDPCALVDRTTVAGIVGVGLGDGVPLEAVVIPIGRQGVRALECRFPADGRPETGVTIRVTGEKAASIERGIRPVSAAVPVDNPHGATFRVQSAASAAWARFGPYSIVVQVALTAGADPTSVSERAMNIAEAVVEALAQRPR